MMIIKPTNISSSPKSTHVNFNSCEEIIREDYNISKFSYITFLQIEINNTINQSLVNKVKYQAYDEKKNLLHLSVCNNTDIEIVYSIKNGTAIDLSLLSTFKDLNI